MASKIKNDCLKMEKMILVKDRLWVSVAPKRDCLFHDHTFKGTKTHVHINQAGPFIKDMPWNDEDRL
jgi:hypothetical protein